MDSKHDTLAFLKADHDQITRLFEAYEMLRERRASDIEKSAMVEEICLSLSVHAQVMEDIFYPAMRRSHGDGALMDEAVVELAGTRDLIAQVSTMMPTDPLYDAKLTVLGETFAHHVKRELEAMPPKACAAGIDLTALGAELHNRSCWWRAEYGHMLNRSAPEDEAADPVGRRTM